MKNKSEKNRNAYNAAIVFAALALVISIMTGYARIQDRTIEEQVKNMIRQSTIDVSEMIDYSKGYAANSIQVTSAAVSAGMTEKELKDPAEILSQFIESTPFSSIEYIRWDGINMTDAGDPFDASGREYYIQGIQGKTGIWINFQPKYSKEPLLNFYTPLYYEGSIAGVLTGTMGGNTNIAPMFISELYDQKVSGLLIDEYNQIIASNEKFNPGVVLNEDTAQVSDKNMKKFFDAIDRADGSVFTLKGKYGSTICSVSEVRSTGWKVIQIIEARNFGNIMKKTNTATYIAIGSVLAISIIISVIILMQTRKRSKAKINKANSERDEQISVLLSIADIYYSMHLINLDDDTAMEYSSKNEVKTTYLNNNLASASKIMREVMHATMSDEYLEAGLEFTDVSTLKERMKGKKFISKELLGKNVGWIILSFITIEKDENDIPVKIICTTQIIDEEKKKEENLLVKSNTDELTGCLNRRAFEDDIAYYPDYPPEEDFVFVSIDINELKIVNDNLGHAAGDELIKGAAECMQRCLGNYGRLYRTGGDEFSAIIFTDHDRLEDIKKDLEHETDKWYGKLVDHVSISCGYAERREFPDMSVKELSKIADKRMYEAKAEHYKKKGVDRRGQSAAHSALCALYTKILKINLTDDTYQIVNMDFSEQTESQGFSDKISIWLSEFGKSGQVHRDDLDEYLRKTDIEYLKDYFLKDKTSISIYYRRNIKGVNKQVVMDMIPANDYSHENQTLFLYVKSIDK